MAEAPPRKAAACSGLGSTRGAVFFHRLDSVGSGRAHCVRCGAQSYQNWNFLKTVWKTCDLPKDSLGDYLKRFPGRFSSSHQFRLPTASRRTQRPTFQALVRPRQKTAPPWDPGRCRSTRRESPRGFTTNSSAKQESKTALNCTRSHDKCIFLTTSGIAKTLCS